MGLLRDCYGTVMGPLFFVLFCDVTRGTTTGPLRDYYRDHYETNTSNIKLRFEPGCEASLKDNLQGDEEVGGHGGSARARESQRDPAGGGVARLLSVASPSHSTIMNSLASRHGTRFPGWGCWRILPPTSDLSTYLPTFLPTYLCTGPSCLHSQLLTYLFSDLLTYSLTLAYYFCCCVGLIDLKTLRLIQNVD